MILAEAAAAQLSSDVCIVGAGPVGLALAFKLEALGLTTTVLEMGGETIDRCRDDGDIEFRNGHHAAPSDVSRPGIGGTSALWGGRCVAFDDLDFQARDHVPQSGWPIPHSDVSCYYNEALAFLRCSTEELGLGELQAEDATVLTNAVERWSREPALGLVYVSRLASSRRIRLLPSAFVMEVVPEADGAQVRCLRVRRHGHDFEVSARAYVLAGGGLENTRLLLGLQSQSPHVREAAGPALGGFYQGHLTGYIGLIQLKDPDKAAALAYRRDSRGLIYRQRLQIAPAVQLEQRLLNTVFWIDAISIADPIHGSGALSLCYLFLAATGLYRFVSKGLAPTARGMTAIDRMRHWRNIRDDLGSPRELLRTIKTLAQRRRDKQTLINPKGRYLLRYHAEQVPNPESRVLLQASSHPDGPRPLSVDYRVTDQDLDSVLRSHAVIDEWLRRNGIGQLEYLHEGPQRLQAVTDQAFDGYHQIGLTRMASSPSEGPVDPACRLRGMSNLYLGGSCLFPTGGHANPTLPAVALALRLADHLRDIYPPSGEG
jgi:choline dehydrogenase-like flavoprotein